MFGRNKLGQFLWASMCTCLACVRKPCFIQRCWAEESLLGDTFKSCSLRRVCVCGEVLGLFVTIKQKVSLSKMNTSTQHCDLHCMVLYSLKRARCFWNTFAGMCLTRGDLGWAGHEVTHQSLVFCPLCSGYKPDYPFSKKCQGLNSDPFSLSLYTQNTQIHTHFHTNTQGRVVRWRFLSSDMYESTVCVIVCFLGATTVTTPPRGRST